MDAQIEFIGIQFRSTSHLHWFQGSMAMFACSMGGLLYLLIVRPAQDVVRLVVAFWCVILLFHVGACIGATGHAQEMIAAGKSPNGRLFSVDCIWFNALMSLVYTLTLVAHRFARRRLSAP